MDSLEIDSELDSEDSSEQWKEHRWGDWLALRLVGESHLRREVSSSVLRLVADWGRELVLCSEHDWDSESENSSDDSLDQKSVEHSVAALVDL